MKPPGGDKSTGPEYEAVYALFMSIAFVLVNLRFYVRTRMVSKLWWDDFFLLLGMVRTQLESSTQCTDCCQLVSIVAFGLAVAKVNSGFGRHIYYLSPEQISFVVKLEFISIQASGLSSMFTRISICLFLLRIFVADRVWNNRVWKRAMYIIIALIVVTTVSAAIVALFLCKPLEKLWNSDIKGTCWPQETEDVVFYYQGGKTPNDMPILRNTILMTSHSSKLYPSSPTFYQPLCPSTS